MIVPQRFSALRALATWLAMSLCCSPRAERQPEPGPGRLIDVEEGKLYVESCGSGSPTLVLVHDGVVNSAVWDDVWPTLCREFRVFRYDRRGYGRSPAATAWHTETDDLLAVIDQTGRDPVVIVGSSHGGEISIDLTLLYPDRVRQLLLVGAMVG